MIILPYQSPRCGVLAARFSNLTKFERSHRHDAITYTHDIFHNKCPRPHHATQKISNIYIENKYHHLTLQKIFRLLLNKGVHILDKNVVFTMSVDNQPLTNAKSPADTMLTTTLRMFNTKFSVSHHHTPYFLTKGVHTTCDIASHWEVIWLDEIK